MKVAVMDRFCRIVLLAVLASLACGTPSRGEENATPPPAAAPGAVPAANPGATTQPSVEPKGYVLDGEVSAAEESQSWKSDRFRIHGPGSPPYADPETHTFIGKTDIEGKSYLYIAFVCVDPDPNSIVNKFDPATPAYRMEQDDSIEIYMDTLGTRESYYHFIVNTTGKYWSRAIEKGDRAGGGIAWDPTPKIKTSTNFDTGRWTLEMLIPFDQIGGPPQQGTRWTANFARNYRGQNNNKGYQCWANIYGGGVNYHRPDLFKEFVW